MEITKEALEKRLDALEAARARHMASAHACDGAIEDCNWWLSHLEKIEQPKQQEETKKLTKVE